MCVVTSSITSSSCVGRESKFIPTQGLSLACHGSAGLSSLTLLLLARKLLHTSGPLPILTFTLTTSSSKAGWAAGSYSHLKAPLVFFTFLQILMLHPLLFQLLPSLQLHAQQGQAVMTALPPEGSLPAQNHLITISEADSPSPHVWPYFLTDCHLC